MLDQGPPWKRGQHWNEAAIIPFYIRSTCIIIFVSSSFSVGFLDCFFNPCARKKGTFQSLVYRYTGIAVQRNSDKGTARTGKSPAEVTPPGRVTAAALVSEAGALTQRHQALLDRHTRSARQMQDLLVSLEKKLQDRTSR